MLKVFFFFFTLVNFILLSSFRFTESLSRKYREFPYTSSHMFRNSIQPEACFPLSLLSPAVFWPLTHDDHGPLLGWTEGTRVREPREHSHTWTWAGKHILELEGRAVARRDHSLEKCVPAQKFTLWFPHVLGT